MANVTPVTHGAPAFTGALVADVPAQLSDVQWAMLDQLVETTAPIGARTLCSAIGRLGFRASEASVSRMLIDLDARGLTERIGSKGRVATAEGQRLVQAARATRERESELSRALDITTVKQVIDLLSARRGVEGEAVRAAAHRIRTEEIDELQALLAQHKQHLLLGTGGRHCALDFHRQIARFSGNPLLVTLSETVLSTHLDYLERVLDIVTLSRGSNEVSADDHQEILDALAAGDAEGAEGAMRAHLSRLIEELENFRGHADSGAFTNVLRMVRGGS